jgi:hypothetical protein
VLAEIEKIRPLHFVLERIRQTLVAERRRGVVDGFAEQR